MQDERDMHPGMFMQHLFPGIQIEDT